MTSEPAPPGFRLVLDPTARATDGGRVLIGGSPLRILTLTEAGQRLVDRWAAGEPIGATGAERHLARRLLDAGLAHPRPPEGARPHDPSEVAVVVPIHGSPDGLAATLDAVLAAGPGAVVVVDDGSSPDDAAAIAAVVRRATVAAPDVPSGASAGLSDRSPGSPRDDPSGPSGAAAGAPAAPSVQILRSPVNEGPAAARQRGVEATEQPVLAFVDADVVPEPGWLDPLLDHLADPAVAAVAPRIGADPPATLPAPVASYERLRSSLDRGPLEALVRPGSRVSYVPTATLVLRRAALDDVGGFDAGLRFGEDVDLVWRLGAAGWSVRYDPRHSATHPARPDLGAWLRQRFAYGRSAAPLAVRHGAAVAPLTVSGWSAAGWALVAAGAPAAGAALMAGTTAALAPKLRNLEHPGREAVRLAGLGHLFAGRQVASALRRAWFPLLGALLLSRRSRLAGLAALVVPPLLDRREAAAAGPGPATWVAVSLADDLAYGAGLWAGVLAHRRQPGAWRALLPGRTGPFPPP
ncbi:MAG: mycofactocin biosynthesis glycosyltransferase MftF [Acidimicrobiia bacterium]